MPDFSAPGGKSKHRIEIKLRELPQLFNQMDPAPFHERDLDPAAADYIASWADEYPLGDTVEIVFHLGLPALESDPQGLIESAVHNYFRDRASDKRLEFRRLMREGQKALAIGLVFLGACVALVQALPRGGEPTVRGVLRESLLIAGWVAMWRPMQIYLYDWWPIRRRRRLFEKLACAPIRVLTG